MPDNPRNPATDPHVGDQLVHSNGKLTLTVTAVPSEALAKEGQGLVCWKITGGTEPMHFNDPPAEYARLFARSLSTGAIFHSAPTGHPSKLPEAGSEVGPPSAPSV